MRGKSLMLIGSTPPAIGAGLVDEVLRFWSENDRPHVSTHTIEAILSDPGPLAKECQVAWILVDQPQLEGLYDLIALLQDRHLPSLVTRPQENNPLGGAILEGAVAAPPSSPPGAIAAVLRTLWGQADVLQVLKTELSMLYLQHGGMIDQFGKIDEELRLAAQLQRDFLPLKLPESPSVEIDVLFRPAGYVSGDIYDVRRLDEKHVGIFLADAVGHGVPAALMTAYIKSSLTVRQFDAEAASGGRIVPPDETLGHLNADILQNRSVQVRTATAVYGVLNTQTLEMEIARAGHPYPILIRADGSSLSLAPDGALMGVFRDEVYELGTVQLQPGDRLLLYTDGFEMAFPGPRPAAGRKRAVANDHYIEEFRELARLPISQIVAKLAARLDLQAGSLNQFDDMTVLFVGIADPPAATASAGSPSEIASAA